MRLAAVQFRPVEGDKPRSLQALCALAEQAARDSDLVVLPELAATHYLFPDAEAAYGLAEAPQGPTFQALSPLARAHRAWMVCGLVERGEAGLYNSALVLDHRGELRFVYRKTLLFEADHAWARPGDSGYRAFDTPFGRLGVGICMDLNDRGFTRWVAQATVDVLALPTNWLEEGLPVWPYWAWRISGTGAVLVAANTWGSEGDIAFCGRSAILKPAELLAGAGPSGDAVISSEV